MSVISPQRSTRHCDGSITATDISHSVIQSSRVRPLVASGDGFHAQTVRITASIAARTNDPINCADPLVQGRLYSTGRLASSWRRLGHEGHDELFHRRRCFVRDNAPAVVLVLKHPAVAKEKARGRACDHRPVCRLRQRALPSTATESERDMQPTLFERWVLPDDAVVDMALLARWN